MTSFLAATTFGFSDLGFSLYLIAINIVLLFPIARRTRSRL
jgi:hypothetical protein